MEFLECLAMILGLSASYLMGSGHKRLGFSLFAMSSFISIIINYNAGQMVMMCGSMGYMIMEVRGWFKAHYTYKD